MQSQTGPTSAPSTPFYLPISPYLSLTLTERKQLQQPNSGNHVFYSAPNVRVANKGDCGINRQLVVSGRCRGLAEEARGAWLARRVAWGLGNATKRAAATAAAAPLPTGNGLRECGRTVCRRGVCVCECVRVCLCVDL